MVLIPGGSAKVMSIIFEDRLKLFPKPVFHLLTKRRLGPSISSRYTLAVTAILKRLLVCIRKDLLQYTGLFLNSPMGLKMHFQAIAVFSEILPNGGLKTSA